MSIRTIIIPCIIIPVSSLLLVICGCEDDGGTTNAEFYINPSSATLASNETTVVLQAVGGHNPLSWSVSDASKGSVSSNGQTVTYTRVAGKYGINIVTVTDSMSWTADATISQPEPGVAATNTYVAISPASATLNNNGNKIVFTASKGSEPYTWSVGDGARGHIDASGDQCTYTRDAAGDNTIIVTDAGGHRAIVNILQPATATLAVSPSATSVTGLGGVVVFTVSGGTGSYTWSVQSGDVAGSISPTTGNSTAYTSTSTNTTVIKVQDSAATTAFATVTKM